jgi:hypothetical protein
LWYFIFSKSRTLKGVVEDASNEKYHFFVDIDSILVLSWFVM